MAFNLSPSSLDGDNVRDVGYRQPSASFILLEPSERRPKQFIYRKIGQNYYKVSSSGKAVNNGKKNVKNNADDCDGKIVKDSNGIAEINYRLVLKYLKHACPLKKATLLQAIRWVI